MLEQLQQIDTELFLMINRNLANPVCDLLMPAATNEWILRGILLAIVLALVTFGKTRGRLAAVGCIIAVAISDQVSAQLIKPLVERVRPCHVVAGVHLLVNCTQGLSFPSSHAANTFGQAMFLGALYPRARWYLFGFAAIVSYSRIAVGVHYPFDVVVGASVGVLCGSFVYWLWRQAARRYPAMRAHT